MIIQTDGHRECLIFFFFCVKSQQEEIYNHDLKNISFLIPLGIEKYYIYVIFGKTDLELFKVKMEHVLGK